VTPGEEEIAFHYYLGCAVTHWAHVESSIFAVVAGCFAKQDTKLLGLGFFSIENFRSKLMFADAIVFEKYESTEHLHDWEKLLSRAKNCASKRNKLAHQQVIVYPHNVAGRRCALVPWIGPEVKKQPAPHKPPPDALCIRDVIGYQSEFHALALALWNFQARVSGREERFAKSLEQAERPPTIRVIKNLIHEALGHQPPPSRKKP
jgi:hypothetical protein